MTENRIEVNGMRVWAHHGCMEEEAIIGQEYRIDVTIWADLGPSAATDDLDKTVSPLLPLASPTAAAAAAAARGQPSALGRTSSHVESA